MTRREQAEKIIAENVYPFDICFADQVVRVQATTAAMNKLFEFLWKIPTFQALEPVHPEFLGFDPVIVAMNLANMD
jgi:hypothetical protein